MYACTALNTLLVHQRKKLIKMNNSFKKLPICKNHCSKSKNSIIDQPKPQKHSRFQTTLPKNDYCEFEYNDIVDYGTDRRNYITNDDCVPGYWKNSMPKFVKKSTVKIHNKWNKASNKKFADDLITDNGFNWDTDNRKRKYDTTIIPSSNNKDSDMSDDNMQKTKRTRMTVPQKLSMGLNINQPLKYCPFCSYITSAYLDRHIITIHENVMNTPIKENVKQMLSTKSKSYKLIPLHTVRDIVGRKLWRDQKIRKVLYNLFKTTQVELWLGSWELPNVPFVDHVTPYVKASYMNDWYEQEEAEEVDTPCPSPLPVITSIYTEGGEQHFNNSEHNFTESVQSFNDSVQGINDSEQSLNSSVQNVKNNEQILNDSVNNISETILNIPKYSQKTTAQLKKAGLLKFLASDHPLISLCRKHLKMTCPEKLRINCIISKYLNSVGTVLRYVQDSCYQNNYKVHHWLVLLQQPDFIIEYLKACETYSQDKETTASHIKTLIPLFSWAMTIFPHQDPKFPMVDGAPDSEEIDGIWCTANQLINTFSDYF
ncbi:unnamed protein product [Aphis gossypii]|uniref:Uncharacterized protein n=1 Tax=Aphis gossypii TaxID=80765 RepID=A0A9P0J9X7_APHGO|nr:unnamed protein product [Aphis gossypii]